MKNLAASLFILLLALRLAPAQEVGDTVRLVGPNPDGVPVHPAAGDSSYVRWANGTVGKVLRKDPATGWLEVEANDQLGWIVRRYLIIVEVSDDVVVENPEAELLSHVIGAWNLEWFHNNKSRGFPETNQGGPSYGPRTDSDYAAIARVITNDLSARLLALSEINGRPGTRNSRELDRLLDFLGPSWQYELSTAGGQQRVALLYDTNAVRKKFALEFVVPRQTVQGEDIFARDPLVGGFWLLDRQGHPQNDFFIVALHLASGQGNERNHNRAMEVLRQRIHAAFAEGTIPAGERDVILAGDLNASAFDNDLENFWTGYDSVLQFRTLIPEDGSIYPGTRLAGVPLFPSSQIDYILASGLENGALDDIVQWVGHVHTELLVAGPDAFRRQISDHLPVTIRLKVQADDD